MARYAMVANYPFQSHTELNVENLVVKSVQHTNH